jgi:hypothetical protein
MERRGSAEFLSFLRESLRDYSHGNEACDYIISFHRDQPASFPRIKLISSYTFNNGVVERNLVQLSGRVNIRYQNGSYKLPAYMILPKDFPLAAPVVYMDPSEGMVRNARSPYVDGNLAVTTEYLDKWTYPFSSLSSMYEDMQELFSKAPPLKSKSNSVPSHALNDGMSSRGVPSGKGHMTRQIVDSLHSLVNESLATEYMELSDSFAFEKSRAFELQQQKTELQQELEKIEQTISQLTSTTRDLDEWLALAEDKVDKCRRPHSGKYGLVSGKTQAEVDAYDAMAPMCGPKKEALEAEACLLAVQDAVKALDFSLAESRINWSTYKKMLSHLTAYKFQAKIIMRRNSSPKEGAVLSKIDCGEWKYPDVVDMLQRSHDNHDNHDNHDKKYSEPQLEFDLRADEEDIRQENPLRRQRVLGLFERSHLFRSVP